MVGAAAAVGVAAAPRGAVGFGPDGGPAAVAVGATSRVSGGVGVVHGSGVSVDCARGVAVASKDLGAALGPQANATTAHSITSCATDLEYGGTRVPGIADILKEMERS